jgi:hypothetical protein
MESNGASVGELCPILNWVLEIWHRPKLSRIQEFKEDGFTQVVTIISEKEGAQKLIS